MLGSVRAAFGRHEDPHRPVWHGDLYAREHLDDPYPAYRTLRDLGAAVWMPRRRLWAVGRHQDVMTVLKSKDELISGKGVAANGFINAFTPPITLTSDGADHDRRRRVLRQPLGPAPLKALRPRLQEQARARVDDLLGGDTFEAMSRFASHLPLTVVSELVGLNEAGRANMLRWSAATFDLLGVVNGRGWRALPHLMQMKRYVDRLEQSDVEPGGWADRLFEAARNGTLTKNEARLAVIDYVAPALDTTILATGHMLWRLATTPGAYETLRGTPSLIPGIINESVRLGSPIRGFTRLAQEPMTFGDVTVPAGDRVLVLFASANRCERHYDNADDFDIHRNPLDHVGWGRGAHVCVGMHLARLEMEVLLEQLVAAVGRIEVDSPVVFRNNVLQGFSALPARFHAA